MINNINSGTWLPRDAISCYLFMFWSKCLLSEVKGNDDTHYEVMTLP